MPAPSQISLFDSTIADSSALHHGADSIVSDTLKNKLVALSYKKEPERENWEYAVSYPFWIASLPVAAFFYGISSAAGYFTTVRPSNIMRYFVSPDRTRLLFPYASSRRGVGLKFLKKGWISSDSKFTARASMWTLGRANALLSFNHVEPWNDLFFLGASGQYVFFPTDRFFGIGNETRESDSTRYAIREFIGSITIGTDVVPDLSVYVTPELTQFKTLDPGGDNAIPVRHRFSRQEAPGNLTTEFLAGAVLWLTFDHTDNGDRPTKGIRVLSRGGWYDQIGAPAPDFSQRFGYWLFESDLLGFVPMPWGPYRELALRVNLQVERPLPDNSIPFFLRSVVGSPVTVRGYPRGRFYDNDRFLLSGEYRFQVWTFMEEYFDAFLFADAGQVAGNIFAEFSFDRFHVGYGGGIRLFVNNTAIGQFLVGVSAENVEFYLESGIYP